MPLNVTAASILTRARYKADAETNSPSTDFETDTEIATYINDAYRKLLDIIIDEGGFDPLITSATLTSPYAVPAGFYRPVGVDIPDGSEWVPLKAYAWANRHSYQNTSRPRYRITGGNVTFSPASAAPASIKLWYIPAATTLVTSDPSTSFDSYNGWDDFMVNDVAIQLVRKEDRDVTALTLARNEAEARVRRAAASYRVGDPETVADVEVYDEEMMGVWE